MKTRIITAVVALCLLIPVLIFSDTVVFPVVLALCSVLALYEMLTCIKLKQAWILSIPLYLVAAGLPFLIRYSADRELVRQVGMVTALVVSLYFFAVLIFSHGKYELADVAICFMTSFYIIAGFNAILILRDFEVGGSYVYLTVFLGAWVTDTFAYFCGILFGRGGKHKLIPDVSPKKTVEGSIGGIVFCVLAMLIYGMVINQITDLNANYLVLAVGGLLASIVSQIGDLCMSLIKRTYGIKDYGKLFPGHGGVLDRFDSVIAVAVVLASFCSFFSFF
ncbi:MAG: phosphatidate cytidylyltransferase [Clostridia bacterium]|nr:phosphatidate cytidylyltransferase [Clostridia bacterium]